MKAPVLGESMGEKLGELLGVGSDHAKVRPLALASDALKELGWGHARVVNSGDSSAALWAAGLVHGRAETKAENLALVMDAVLAHDLEMKSAILWAHWSVLSWVYLRVGVSVAMWAVQMDASKDCELASV